MCPVLFLLFLLFGNSCADNSSAADEQQCDPQHEAACVAGLGRLRQLRRYRAGFFDFLGAVFVAVIPIAAAAVPILDVALGILGGRLGGDKSFLFSFDLLIFPCVYYIGREICTKK